MLRALCVSAPFRCSLQQPHDVKSIKSKQGINIERLNGRALSYTSSQIIFDLALRLLLKKQSRELPLLARREV